MDRLIGWFRSVVREMTAELPYAGSYRYEVAGQDVDAQTLDLKPLGHKQPALEAVPMRVPGLKMTIANGAEVVVAFANNDPTLPFVAQYPQDPAQVTKVEILGETAANAREGDEVTISIEQWEAGIPTNAGGTVTLTNPMKATITSGSDKVFS